MVATKVADADGRDAKRGEIGHSDAVFGSLSG
jgi:hypothetical protein